MKCLVYIKIVANQSGDSRRVSSRLVAKVNVNGSCKSAYLTIYHFLHTWQQLELQWI